MVRHRCSLPGLAWLCFVLLAVTVCDPSDAAAQSAVLSEGVDPSVATPIQLEQAQSRFMRGKELFTEGDFEAALAEFDASRSIVASPNARLYSARCLRRLGRDVEAFAAYGRAMIEAMELAKQESRYTKTAEAARTERAELAQTLAFVKLTIYGAKPETELWVDGERIRRAAWSEPVVVRSGKSQLELKTPGVPTQVRTLDLASGATEEVVLSVNAPPGDEPEQAPPPAEPVAETKISEPVTPQERPASLRPYAYAATALAVVGGGAFGYFGYKSTKTHDDLVKACPGGQCPNDEGDRIDRGKQQQLFANIGLGVGVVGLGAAVTLFLLEPDDTDTAFVISPFGVAVRGTL